MRAWCLVAVFVWGSGLLIAQTPASPATGGVIRGRVLVPASPAPTARPLVADLGGETHPPIDRRRVVVYLESAPRPAFADMQPGRTRMDQRGQQFVPHVLAVTAGTIVAGQVGLWLYAQAEGGVLSLPDHLAQTYGPLVPLQAVIAIGVTWWTAR